MCVCVCVGAYVYVGARVYVCVYVRVFRIDRFDIKQGTIKTIPRTTLYTSGFFKYGL